MLGGSVVDFSPLRDEALPPGTDVVYLGCGQPERFADALAENHCIKSALRSHLRNGGRIYAEGGGLAYLCQQMEARDGRLQRTVGIVPAVARLRKCPRAPTPLEVVLSRSNWLGGQGTRLRGYLNPNWVLEPTGLAAQDGFSCGRRRGYIVGCFQLVGSLVHLNFAAYPAFLRRFFCPFRPGRSVANPLTGTL
jgi:cobyrinic acid a,c-diamide synthase